MPGRKLGAEVIDERILARYPLPHTVSIVEAEMNALDAHADRRERMLDVARRIFAHPFVEIASHTYSHPFVWKAIGRRPGSGTYNLPIPGYDYTPSREVDGSVAFIDERLAPPGKRTRVFLWSGDALPGAAELAATERLGLQNLNGGNTVITRAQPALSLVSPMARLVGEHAQVYAPIMNENVYTNDWQGPYDGFRRVVETLEMTDRPRRLKPLNIYYHFYAGTKIASLHSLEEVCDWSVRQDIQPIFASEYAAKARDFRAVTVARALDGRWTIGSLGEIQSVRLPRSGAWPALDDARGIAGARRLHDGVYVHTGGGDTVSFRVVAEPPSSVRLHSSNARVRRWSADGSAVRFRLSGHVPVVLELMGTLGASCSVWSHGARLPGLPVGEGRLRFDFPTTDTGDARLDCPA